MDIEELKKTVEKYKAACAELADFVRDVVPRVEEDDYVRIEKVSVKTPEHVKEGEPFAEMLSIHYRYAGNGEPDAKLKYGVLKVPADTVFNPEKARDYLESKCERTHSFYGWLKVAYKEGSQRREAFPPGGDLLDDAMRDPKFPRLAKDYMKLRNYLERCGACDDAMEAYDRVYNEYAEVLP